MVGCTCLGAESVVASLHGGYGMLGSLALGQSGSVGMAVGEHLESSS